ncbi:hypothetical protein E4P41_14440 [Geodermatophilus sp. DF01-2]|uniref:hypothetical protein n=1 Tax=Geodermatophilus sp. DF01-2 TaxID=2559610 RepID=UPI0010745060|nr:hypothetical protein [Geodermatophilus sp. DF01_2]TFV57428.1 hypothetical protein E4P41_14440 [Geodermatophilus sp. DF01_2]
MRSRAIVATAPLLALAACASPAAGPAPQAVAVEPAVQAVAVAQPGTPTAEEPAAATTSCTSPDGYSVEYPDDWSTNEAGVLPACSWFGPGGFVVPEASDVRTAPVTLQVVDLPLAEAAAPLPDEVDRTELEVDGRAAVRTEQVTTVGLYPAGTRITSWAVDLGGRTLLADAVELPGGDHERAVAVLDEMVRSLEPTAG